jgi:hypothetical protein
MTHPTVTVGAVVSPGERQGLVNLFLATNGPSWISPGAWRSYTNLSIDPCGVTTPWSGVTCNGVKTSIMCVASLHATDYRALV